MKIQTLFITLLFISQGIFAQTSIKNGQEVFGTWTKSNSPYIIQGEAIVPALHVLTIEPGVVIKFKAGTNRDYRYDDGSKNNLFDVGFLRVEGKIIAEGNKDNRIKFTSDGEGNWGNIVLDTREYGSKFQYCIFEKAYYMRSVIQNDAYTDNATGALSFINSQAMVEYCIFANNGWTAINCKRESKPTLKNLTLYNNQYGLECNTGSMPTFISCILWKSRELTFYINGDSKPHISFSLIQDESLDYNYDKGNNIFAQDPKFKKPDKGNFKLKGSSPCKNAGIEDKNMGAE